MSPKKLSEADKNQILKLYRESEETTSTLAERYQVSSSTISRFLKASLSLEEYEELIQKKRLARNPSRRQTPDEERIDNLTSEIENPITTKPDFMSTVSRKSSQPIKKNSETGIIADSLPQLDLFALTDIEDDEDEDEDEDGSLQESVLALQQLLGEDIGVIEDYGDEEEDEDEDEDEDSDILMSSSPHPSHVNLEILPLAQAELPKVCYLVIDRRSELITKPLKDFRDLGKIPLTEVQEQTLPIFDNHRIARRFSNRRERVIKVPDSQLFRKTTSYLQAKGITRILLDGQVYSLD
jgi:transposase-like protein